MRWRVVIMPFIFAYFSTVTFYLLTRSIGRLTTLFRGPQTYIRHYGSRAANVPISCRALTRDPREIKHYLASTRRQTNNS